MGGCGAFTRTGSATARLLGARPATSRPPNRRGRGGPRTVDVVAAAAPAFGGSYVRPRYAAHSASPRSLGARDALGLGAGALSLACRGHRSRCVKLSALYLWAGRGRDAPGAVSPPFHRCLTVVSESRFARLCAGFSVLVRSGGRDQCLAADVVEHGQREAGAADQRCRSPPDRREASGWRKYAVLWGVTPAWSWRILRRGDEVLLAHRPRPWRSPRVREAM